MTAASDPFARFLFGLLTRSAHAIRRESHTSARVTSACLRCPWTKCVSAHTAQTLVPSINASMVVVFRKCQALRCSVDHSSREPGISTRSSIRQM